MQPRRRDVDDMSTEGYEHVHVVLSSKVTVVHGGDTTRLRRSTGAAYGYK